jgi:hypothetical protein
MEMYVEILTSLLTGGVLVLFVESQQLANSVRDRFVFVMHPFMKSLTAYLRFLSFYKSSYRFNKGQFTHLQDDIDYLSRLGGKSIVAGKNIPVDYFSARQLENICDKINNIWYLIDRNRHDFYTTVTFQKTLFVENCKSYLLEVDLKYTGYVLDRKSIESVSESFYTEIYSPIQDIPYEYEAWQGKDLNFRIISYISIAVTLLSVLILLTFGDSFVNVVYSGMCFICICLFGLQVFLNIILYRFSLHIFK